MNKLLFITLVSLSIWKNVLHGKDVCNHYDDKDCVHPDITKHGHYTNQWSVYVPGMAKNDVKQLMEDNGFIYLGQVMDGVDLYLVTKTGTQEKHVMPDKRIIEQLKKIENVQSVTQNHVFDDSPNAVYSVKEANEIECLHLNPDEIVLNDGSNNWERISMVTGDAEGEKDKPTATQFAMTRPVSNNQQHKTAGDDDDDDGGDDAVYDKTSFPGHGDYV